MKLEDWCLVYCRRDSSLPQMMAGIAGPTMAEKFRKSIRDDGHLVIGYFPASDLPTMIRHPDVIELIEQLKENDAEWTPELEPPGEWP